jgi:predicted nucleic acid-binding protein
VIVADASAVIEVLLNTASGTAVSRHLFAPKQSIHVPHLMDVEVLQVLRRYARIHTLSSERADQALQDYASMPLNRYSHDVLLSRIWELRHNLTAYDAAYIALAEALEAPLVSCDRALASASGHWAKVLVF